MSGVVAVAVAGALFDVDKKAAYALGQAVCVADDVDDTAQRLDLAVAREHAKLKIEILHIVEIAFLHFQQENSCELKRKRI